MPSRLRSQRVLGPLAADEYVAMAGSCNLTLSPCPKGQSAGLAGYMKYCESRTVSGCGMAMAAALAAARSFS